MIDDDYARIRGDYEKYLRGTYYKDRQFTIADPPWEFDDEPRHFGIKYKRWDDNIFRMLDLLIDVTTPLFFIWAPVSLGEELFRAINIHNNILRDSPKRLWRYKNRFTWRKLTKNGKLHYGTGHWARNSVEDLFILAKSTQKPIRLDMRNTFDEQYLGNTHKPREFEYQLVKELYERQIHKGVYLFSGNKRLEFFKTFDIHLLDIDMPEFDLEQK